MKDLYYKNINGKKPISDQITIIIPTHYRHNYLKRILAYYHILDSQIIIADSTNKPFSNTNTKANVRYLHYPEFPYADKLHLAVEQVDTPYAVFCPDDDFIIPSSIYKCVSFLCENTDYSSAQGKYIIFYKDNRVYRPVYVENYKMNIDSDQPWIRAMQQFDPYMHQSYSVHRIENLQQAYFSGNKLKNYNLIEILLSFISSINGKHKILPIFYGAREHSHQSTGSLTPSLLDIYNSEEYNAELKLFMKYATKHLAQNCNYSYQECYEMIEKALNIYLHKFLSKYSKIGIKNRIISKAKELLGTRSLKILEAIKNPLYEKYQRNIAYKRNQRNFLKYFNAFGKEGLEQLKYMQSIIDKSEVN